MLFAHRAACGRIGLVALAALLAAAALAAVLHSTPASAQPPDDLELILSLVGDSDNVVPPESTITVAATLRHMGLEQNLEITAGSLRVSGSLDWETLGRSALPITPQKIGAAAWRGSGALFGDRFGAFGGAILAKSPVANSSVETFFIKSLQNEYIGEPGQGTWRTSNGKFYVYDVETKREVAIINPPDGAERRGFTRGFAGYMESDTVGWIFVGSHNDTMVVPGATCNGAGWSNTGTTCAGVGRVYIYKYDRSASDPADWTVELAATITPSAADAVMREENVGTPSSTANRRSYHRAARFGISVSLSASSETLVVGADRMHEIGVLKVFTKPSSAGGWADLTYASAAATLSGAPLPAEDSAATYTNKQKSYAGRRWSSGYDGSGFGETSAISADGNYVISGTFKKQYDDNYNWYRNWRFTESGEVTIFKKPSGGWADSSTATGRLWLATPPYNFNRLGQYLAVSRDGRYIAASAAVRPGNNAPGAVHLWDAGSGITWTDDTTPDAEFTAQGGSANDQFGHIGVDFNWDATKLAISNHKYQDTGMEATSSFFGRAWIFDRPAGGWATATTTSPTARQVESPEPRAGAFYGIIQFVDDDSGRVIVTQHEDASTLNTNVGPGAVWLLKPDPDRAGRFLPEFFAGSTCTIINGEALFDSTDDTNMCPIDLSDDAQLVLAPGFDSGSFTISGRVTIDEQVIRGSLVVNVGKVKEVARATLEVGTDDRGSLGTADDRPHKSTLSPGETTVLRLRVLNENDAASGPNSISSILITAGGGLLSTNINDEELAPGSFSTARRNQDGCVGTGGLACQIRVASLNTANSDKIDIMLRAPSPAKPGQVQVRAVVLSRTGESVEAEPLTIAFAGPPTDYAIAKPTTSVLNQDTPDEGAAADHRDRLLLSVTAADASGNQVELPGTAYQVSTRARAIPEQHRLTILAPNGRRTTAGVSARWLPNAAGTGLQLDRAENPQIEIDVDAEETDKLANGEYTIELRVGAKTVTQKFVVSGGPATLALGEPQGSTAVNGQIRLTATVLDDEGNAVPNGTRVTWVDRPTGAVPVMIQLSADTRTEDGAASANFLVIGSGTGYVTATAGDATNIVLLQVGGPGERGEAAIAESLSSTRPGFSTWLGGEQRTRASQLLAAVDGVSSALLWDNGIWLRYGVAESGLVIPGSMDFVIRHGAVLWLSE